MPVKKGLISPQNTFVEAIIRKYDGSPDRNFVLGNAQVDDLPIIFCNDGFCELTGYSRAELVQRHCSCDFLCGEETNMLAADEIKDALQGDHEKHVEILYYRKDVVEFEICLQLATADHDSFPHRWPDENNNSPLCFWKHVNFISEMEQAAKTAEQDNVNSQEITDQSLLLKAIQSF